MNKVVHHAAFRAVRYCGWNQCAFLFIVRLEGVGLTPRSSLEPRRPRGVWVRDHTRSRSTWFHR